MIRWLLLAGLISFQILTGLLAVVTFKLALATSPILLLLVLAEALVVTGLYLLKMLWRLE